MEPYIIVRARSFESLATQVCDKMVAGYIPVGSAIVFEESVAGFDVKHHAQAMVRDIYLK